MSLELTASSIQYAGNDATTVFPVPFRFLEDGHLTVTLDDGTTTSLLTLGVDYTVDGAGNEEGLPGEVTLAVAPAEGETLTVERNTPIVQDVNYRTQGSFAPDTHEASFDHRAMVEQELDRRLSSIEGQGLLGDAAAGNGLTVTGSTWHVGAGAGIVTSADAVAVDFSDAEPEMLEVGGGGAGTSAEASRADHRHDILTAAPGAVTVGAAASEGASLALARADHTHAVAAPAAPANVTRAAAAAGSSSAPARADHKHDVSTASAGTITDSTNAEGSSTALARADHQHAHGNRGGGSLHALATTSTPGFLSAADKGKLDVVQNGFGGTAFTTDATPTVVAALDTSATSKGAWMVEAQVVGARSNGAPAYNEAGGYQLAATFKKTDDATLIQVGSTTAIATHENTAGWNAAFSVLANQIQVVVTGIAGSNISWTCSARYVAAK